MRDIKFRAFMKDENRIIDNIIFHEFEDINTQFEDDELIFMQYTGLKDKNGVEIYEGDIIKDGSRLWKIQISPIYGIFFILTKGGHSRCYGDFVSYLVDEFKVIGNIYKDSHLLDNN